MSSDKISLDIWPFSSSYFQFKMLLSFNSKYQKAVGNFNRLINKTNNLSTSFLWICKYCNSQNTEFLCRNINSVYVVIVSKIMINCLVLWTQLAFDLLLLKLIKKVVNHVTIGKSFESVYTASLNKCIKLYPSSSALVTTTGQIWPNLDLTIETLAVSQTPHE